MIKEDIENVKGQIECLYTNQLRSPFKSERMGAVLVKEWLGCINQLQQENEALKSDNLNVKDLLDENKKQKEILEILKSKCIVGFWDIEHCDTAEEYNELYPKDSQFIQEEFDKVKEWLENGK